MDTNCYICSGVGWCFNQYIYKSNTLIINIIWK